MATTKKAASDQPQTLSESALRKQLTASLGVVKIVKNKKRKGGAAHSYHAVALGKRGNKKVVAMFTLKEIKAAEERAKKNQEDGTALWELVKEG